MSDDQQADRPEPGPEALVNQLSQLAPADRALVRAIIARLLPDDDAGLELPSHRDVPFMEFGE